MHLLYQYLYLFLNYLQSKNGCKILYFGDMQYNGRNSYYGMQVASVALLIVYINLFKVYRFRI